METKEYKDIEYTKDFHSLTDNVVSVLADGKFPITDRERLDKFYKDLQCDRVLGIIEFPAIDIELEMWTRGGYDYDEATEDDNEISLAYAVCGKVVSDKYCGWETLDWAYKDVSVDFASKDWEKRLEKEMLSALEDYADIHSLSYTEPIER